MGGAEGVPSWGKAWLAILNCYKWEGLSPICPEIMCVVPRAPSPPPPRFSVAVSSTR